jgi:2,3-bisphosphoglycerate-independent phosphoglycerate mutase
MRILFIFLDGIGLGEDDTLTNPFAVAHTPTLHTLSNGLRWLCETGYQESSRAVFIPTDAQLSVPGRPQSGTSQAAILTGKNVPQMIGRHYGPKPDLATRALLAEDNFFKQVIARGKTAALINAYPQGLLNSIGRGKTLRSSIQQGAHEAGLPMFDVEKLYRGEALSEDWTGDGWREHLGYKDTPLYTPQEAGRKMVEIARNYDFAFCSHWLTDTIGHRGTLEEAVAMLERFDGVMEGVLERWDDDEGIIIITSDHGNMEEIGNRHHTENLVPTVVIGSKRHEFAEGFTNLLDLVPRMSKLLLNT